jgi:hypothetical protein
MSMNQFMSLETETKVVQTELTEAEYERLVGVADREDLSLKAALREAAREFVDRRGRHNSDDPFFSPPEPSEPDTDREDLTATETDAYLYE